MGKLVELALYQGIGSLVLLFVAAPVALIGLGWLFYIVAETIRELCK